MNAVLQGLLSCRLNYSIHPPSLREKETIKVEVIETKELDLLRTHPLLIKTMLYVSTDKLNKDLKILDHSLIMKSIKIICSRMQTIFMMKTLISLREVTKTTNKSSITTHSMDHTRLII